MCHAETLSTPSTPVPVETGCPPVEGGEGQIVIPKPMIDIFIMGCFEARAYLSLGRDSLDIGNVAGDGKDVELVVNDDAGFAG